MSGENPAGKGRDSNPPQGRTEPRPEFQALIDAFQPEYDALLKEDR